MMAVRGGGTAGGIVTLSADSGSGRSPIVEFEEPVERYVREHRTTYANAITIIGNANPELAERRRVALMMGVVF